MTNECPIYHKEEIDTNCTINGRWKIGTHGTDNKDEDRFNIHICITCFDSLQNIK